MQAARAGEPDNASGEIVRVPLLARILESIDPETRFFIIDLGGIREATLDRLQGFRCRLDVLDLDVSAMHIDDEKGEEELLRSLNERLPPEKGEKADLLLCWNFLNYFSLHELGLLMAAVLPRLSTEARIHALIESSATQMPARPYPLSILPSGQLSRPASSSQGHWIPTPRHSSEGLKRCLPGFNIDQTVLLANGQKEFLFVRR